MRQKADKVMHNEMSDL